MLTAHRLHPSTPAAGAQICPRPSTPFSTLEIDLRPFQRHFPRLSMARRCVRGTHGRAVWPQLRPGSPTLHCSRNLAWAYLCWQATRLRGAAPATSDLAARGHGLSHEGPRALELWLTSMPAFTPASATALRSSTGCCPRACSPPRRRPAAACRCKVSAAAAVCQVARRAAWRSDAGRCSSPSATRHCCCHCCSLPLPHTLLIWGAPTYLLPQAAPGACPTCWASCAR
jgi:hypothetical protein